MTYPIPQFTSSIQSMLNIVVRSYLGRKIFVYAFFESRKHKRYPPIDRTCVHYSAIAGDKLFTLTLLDVDATVKGAVRTLVNGIEISHACTVTCTRAGAEVYCNHFTFYKAKGTDTTHSDSEVEAMFIALNQLRARKSYFPRAVILSDSKASLQAISNNRVFASDRIYECR
ncbi:hypothetical protein TNCV_3038341 [Trichonephila clavipes]|nr:hypothetical protein TNCV_3038341 [Trichonephila clavipes]